MIRKPPILLIVILLGLIALTACAASPAGATPQTGGSRPIGTITYVAPDQSLSTPAVGTVTVLALEGAHGVFLRSRPDHASDIAGEVQPGVSGTLLGVDASGAWLLVRIKGQTGWAPIQLLSYTIAK